MSTTLPLRFVLRSICLLFLFLSAGVLQAQTPVAYPVDNSVTDYSIVKAVGLPGGKSAVIYRDVSYNYKCSILGSNGAVTTTFDFTSKMVLQNTPARIEVNALGTSSGNIFITYTSNTSDGPPSTNSAKYLVLDQSGNQVFSGTVNSSNPGSSPNRFISLDQLSNGNVVMVWLQSDNVSGGYRIFQSNGTPVTSDVSFAGPSSGIFNTGLAYEAMVAGNPTGGFLVTFYYYNGNFRGILFNNSGAVQQVGGANSFTIDPAVYPSPAGSYKLYSAIGLANGNYVVAWSENAGGTTTGYYAIFNATGGVVKAKTAMLPDMQTAVNSLAWMGFAADNTSGFVMADYNWQVYEDLSNPNVKVIYYNYDPSGNLLSTKDGSPYYIGDYNPALSMFSGKPSGVGVAYVNYKSFTPIPGGYTVSGQDISASFSIAALSNNANLSNLTISSGTLNPAFASGTTSYTVSVSNAISSVMVTPTVADASATVSVNNTPVTSGSPSGPVSLAVGANTITIKVTAQDGTIKTYTITVTRAAAPGVLLSTSPTLTFTNSTGFGDNIAEDGEGGSTAISDFNLQVMPVNSSGAKLTASPLQFHSNADWAGYPSIITYGDIDSHYGWSIKSDNGAEFSLVSFSFLDWGDYNGNTYVAEAFYNGSSLGTIQFTGNTTGTMVGLTNSAQLTSIFRNVDEVRVYRQGGLESWIALNNIRVTTPSPISIPTVTTASATAITTTSATLGGNVTADGGAAVTARGIVYNTTGTPTTADTKLSIGSGTGSFTQNATGLLPNTTYYVRAYATNTAGTAYGNAISFTTAPLSSNADLASLALSAGTLAPIFASGTTSYTASVGNATGSVTVTPTVAESHATLTVNATPVTSGSASASIPLAVGANTITVKVTAQDGVTTKTYTVTVTRAASSTATLSNLALSAGTLSPVFNSGTTGYTASVSNATSSVLVTPTATESTETIKVNGTTVTSGSAFGPVPLAVGANTITVTATAQDGVTTLTYAITVTRAAAPNITATGSFSALNTTYGTPSGTSSITVSGTNLAAGITATVSPSNFELSSDGASFASSITIGSAGTASGTVYVRLKSNAPAGTVTGSVSLSSTGANNPAVAIPTSTVNKASLTVIPDSKSRVYGAADPALTTSFSGFVNGETSSNLTAQPILFTTAIASSPLGNYVIGASGAAAANYTISYITGTLAVTPAPLTITANNVSKTYGQALAGGPGSTAFTQSGLVNGETIGSVSIAYGPGASATDAVGIYTNQVTPVAATGGTFKPANYSITYVNGDIMVSAATATITFSALSNKTYGDADFAPGATSTNTATPITYASSDPLVATIVSGKIHIVGAGTTTITASQAADGNHSAAADQQQLLTVDKKTLTVTLNSTPAISKVYDGTPTATLAAGNYTLNGVAGSDAVTVSGTASYDNANAGAAKTVTVNSFTLSGAQKDNYTLATSSAATTGLITARPVTVTAGAKTKVYGQSDPALTYTASPALLTGDSFTGSLTRAAGEDAGTYAIHQGTLSAGTNYSITYAGANLVITPAAITVTADARNKVYGQADPALTYQVTSGALVPGDSFTGALTRDAGESAGSYAIKQGTLTLNNNYSLSYTGASLTITRAALTITADDKSRVYGSANPVLTVSYSGFVNGDNALSLTTAPTLSTPATASSVVGNYAITASGAVDPNYSISYVAGNLAVTPATLTITADDKTKVYGEALPALTASYSGFVNGDDASGLTTQPTITTLATALSGVGTYAISVNGAASSNYTITYVSGTLAVTAATPTISFNALPAKTYGDADFNGGATSNNSDTPVEYASSNLLVATIVGGNIHIVGAGTTIITASQPADANHNAAADQQQTLTVNPAAITLTADAQSKVYGQVDPVLTYQVTSGALVGSDAFTGSLVREAGEGVGNYVIQQGTLALNNNYTLTYSGANLTINPAALTITADDKTKAYGQVNPVLTASYSGFVNGDDASSLAVQPSFTTLATATTPIGNYGITVSGAVNPNYTISYVAGNLAITPATLTITATAKTKVYGDPDPALTYSALGLVGSDVVTGGLVRTPGNNVGTYAIQQGSLTAGTNYMITYRGAFLTITPRAVTVTAQAQSKTYGQADPALTYSVSPALVSGDVLNGALGRAAGEDAGTYAINQGNLSNPNYAISFTGNVLTINKAAQQITWVQTLTMGCDGVTRSTLTASASSGLPVSYSSADASIATINNNEVVMTGAGTVTLTASQPGNQNYLPALPVTNTLINKLPSYQIAKRWDDVLVFDNSSNQYSEWQWYKNGAAITGATGQYYYESSKLNGSYYAVVKTKAGIQQETCPVSITPGSTLVPIAIFPNPVAPGQTVTIKTGYSSTELQGATIVVSNMLGIVVQTVQTVTPQTNVTMPLAQGIYVIKLRLANGVTASVNALVKPQ